MKLRIFSIFTIMALAVAAFFPGVALAGAYDTSFITSITYQNVDTTATTGLTINFYDSPTTTTPIVITRPNLAAKASTSLFIGGLSEINAGFRGTAVLSSDKKMVATLVQLPQNSTTVKNRPLSNGFSSGTVDSLIATVVNGGYNTIFSVQNAGASSTTVHIKFYNTSATMVHQIDQTLAAGAGYYVDAGLLTAQLGTNFNGSVVIQSDGGSIVSTAMELQTGTGVGARAFEGLGQGSTKFYMPSSLCNYGPTPSQYTNTNYAVQNASLTTGTTVNVTYNNGATQSAVVGPGAKASFNTCSATNMVQNFLGSAVIESTTTPIIAVGKAAGNGLTTAYVGFSSGASQIALPYVRWATTTNFNNGSQQRVNIAIQNVGTSAITSNILVQYIDRDGNIVGTHTYTPPAGGLLPGAKFNSNATNAGLTEFGVYGGGTQFGGGAIVTGPGGSQLAAIARVASHVVATNVNAGEDYNGIPITP